MKRINIEIPTVLHRRAKVKAANESITLKDFIIKSLERSVK